VLVVDFLEVQLRVVVALQHLLQIKTQLHQRVAVVVAVYILLQVEVSMVVMAVLVL
jgi:hypothetical protein